MNTELRTTVIFVENPGTTGRQEMTVAKLKLFAKFKTYIFTIQYHNMNSVTIHKIQSRRLPSHTKMVILRNDGSISFHCETGRSETNIFSLHRNTDACGNADYLRRTHETVPPSLQLSMDPFIE